MLQFYFSNLFTNIGQHNNLTITNYISKNINKIRHPDDYTISLHIDPCHLPTPFTGKKILYWININSRIVVKYNVINSNRQTFFNTVSTHYSQPYNCKKIYITTVTTYFTNKPKTLVHSRIKRYRISPHLDPCRTS